MFTVIISNKPGFNSKSILLQSAITVCWPKQMAAMNGTQGPVSVGPEEMFYVQRNLQTVCSLCLGPRLSMCTALFFPHFLLLSTTLIPVYLSTVLLHAHTIM